jgi:hypothetical protein
VRCAILQPSYIPWRGYFDIIRRVDLFVFYDDVQYDHRSWRNRNRVKSPQGPLWLTIPVQARQHQVHHLPIHGIRVDGTAWAQRHFETLRHLYARAPHFGALRPWLEHVYASPPEGLADFTIQLTIDIATRLGMTTRFLRSSELDVEGAKTERLLRVLERVEATHYLSGPTARDYVEEDRFRDAGIALEWMSYEYREYPQLYPPYDPHVSILDLLFMTGEEAPAYLLPPIDTPGNAD